jgi:RNA polymerase sigma-54 factor
MADQGLYQTQTQKLAIGPQMQQSLQILQAPTLELRQIIQQEVEINPVLELESPDVSLDDAVPDDPDNREERDELDVISQMDDEWREYWAQSRMQTSSRTSEDQERWQFLMDSISAPTTLQEHLISQLRTAETQEPEVVKLTEFLIGSLDDRGFLTTPVEDLSLQHGIPLDGLQKAKDLLTTFDPVGIGADDLRECLLIQLDRLGKRQSLAYRLVDIHLDDLANKRYPILARKMSVPIEQISRASDFISTLDPRPASRFTASSNNYVTPDIIIERQGGEWVPVMNNDDLPHLRLSNAYKDMISQPGSSTEVRNYIRDKLRSGKFLIRSIHQRQQEFLKKGTGFLRPLNMAQVADEVGVHETTVSRAISGKYMATPHGVFELKFFFRHGVKTDSGEDLSNTSVKNAIADLVKNEPKSKPLSDDKLAKILDGQGIKVARRTVAKYREALNILPSHLRKSFS